MRKFPNLPSLSALFVAVALVGGGCFGQRTTPLPPPPPVSPAPPEAMPLEEKAPSEHTDATSTAATSTGMDKVSKATYVGFSRGAYDKALTENVPVMLYFYANWCPTCRAQEPQNIGLFKNLDLNVQAFRVNFNDSETDDEEKKLAKAFGVTYQHTFIFLDRNGKEITRKVGGIAPEELRNLLKEVANR